MGGSRGWFKVEHKVMAKLVGERHQRGDTPKPYRTVRWQGSPAVQLAFGYFRLAEKTHPAAPGPLARARVWRASSMELQRGLLNTHLTTQIVDDLGCTGVVHRDLVEHLQ